MKFVNTKKLENSNGNGAAVNAKENSSQTAKSNLDKRFEALGKVGNTDKKDKKCAINVTLDKKVLDKLNSYCNKHFSSRSAIINRIIAEWLESLKD